MKILLTFLLMAVIGGCSPEQSAKSTDTMESKLENASDGVRNKEGGASTPQETTLEATVRHMLYAKSIDQNFTIDVALPVGAGDGPFPVIYLTDGNLMFPMVNSTMRLMLFGGELPPTILVGIGYENSAEVMALRTRDLTPTLDPAYTGGEGPAALPAHIKPGGADKFLDFIAQEVKPFIESNYPAKSGDDTLVGDSLGGLFALHALFTRPDEYARYLIGSPSIWWDKTVLFQTEQNYADANTDLNARVFISIGGLEQPDTGPAAFAKMVTNMHTMADRLTARNYPSLHLTKYEFEGETHLSVIPATFSRGLREVLADLLTETP